MNSRLLPIDMLRVAGYGVRSRPLRAVLSALGIAIGIAAMIAVVGISYSSRADLEAQLDRLGTNLLALEAGTSIFGDDSTLPQESVGMVERVGSVIGASAIGTVDAKVYRNDTIPSGESGGIAAFAAELDLLTVLDPDGDPVVSGSWLNPATAEYPAVVLGAETAKLLGIHTTDPVSPDGTGDPPLVWLGDQWFAVIGVLAPIELAPELDTAALVGWPAAIEYLGFDGHPTRLYQRTDPGAVEAVRAVLAATANPEHPEEVTVQRPSDALAAQAAIDVAFAGLLLGLGGVALLVGGIGVANTMVISVLERRAEIGLRRALGAARRHIRRQFISEALLLSLFGGLAGVLLGAGVTAGYALSRDWPPTVPLWAVFGALGATLLIGGLAGLLPAIRAARLAPTTALAAA